MTSLSSCVRKLAEAVWLELQVVWSCAAYSLRIIYRYPSNVIHAISTPVIFMFVGVMFSKLISPDTLATYTGGEISLLLYLAGGLAIWLISNASTGLARTVATEISWGTLGASFVTPASRVSIIGGLGLANLIYGGAMALPIIAVVIPLSRSRITFSTCAVILLGLCAFFGVGLVLAAAAIRWRRVGGIIASLAFVEQFFAGVFIPVRAIPPGLRWISYSLPQTWVIDLLRSLGLGLEPLIGLHSEIALLVGLSVGLNCLGLALLRRAERRTRILGIADEY